MHTHKSNSYTMSKDFGDGRARMLGTELEDRLRISPDVMLLIVGPFASELAPDELPIIVDGALWLSELQVYSFLGVLKREDKRDWFRRTVTEVLVQSIVAFTDARRKPPQKPKVVGGEETYECQTPGMDEMFRPEGDEHYGSEVGSIVMMLEAGNDGDLSLSPAEALKKAIEIFDGASAARQRISKWSPIGGSGTSHIA